MKLLWLKAGGLHPQNSGGKIRTYNLLRYLAQRHEVTFVSYYRFGEGEAACDASLERLLSRVIALPSSEPVHSTAAFYASYAKSLWSRTPFQLRRFQNAGVARQVAELLNQEQFDLAVCDFLSPVLNVPVRKSCPWVLFAHNVEAQIWERRRQAGNWLERAIAQIEYWKMRGCEQQQVRRFEYLWTVSEEDKQYFAGCMPENRIQVIRTGVDASFFQRPPAALSSSNTLLFLGTLDWWPNQDAIVNFYRDILPHIRAAVPETEFLIVGRNAGAQLRALARSATGVKLMSSVEDVRPFLHSATAFVVPLRIGGGTRLKIYEAMASGVPVVSTTIGAEGLKVTSGENIILA
ncbi:MAG: glycosyltransferase, partial [Terriglobales bacterium]